MVTDVAVAETSVITGAKVPMDVQRIYDTINSCVKLQRSWFVDPHQQDRLVCWHVFDDMVRIITSKINITWHYYKHQKYFNSSIMHTQTIVNVS